MFTFFITLLGKMLACAMKESSRRAAETESNPYMLLKSQGMKPICVTFLATALLLVTAAVTLAMVIECNFNMAFRTRFVYSGVRDTRACARYTPTIPQVFRQTWKTAVIPAKNAPWVHSWKSGLHANGWQLQLMTDADIDAFVRDEFPYFMPVWDKLVPFIKKIDTVRYMWMLRYGGAYADLDTSLLNAGKLVTLFNTDLKPPVAFIPATHTQPTRNKDRASPAFLGSHPNHPIWIDMLEYIAKHGWHDKVLMATGPVALTNVLCDWKERGAQGSVMLLSETRLGIGHFKGFGDIVRHHNTTGWRDGDGGAVAWTMPDSVFAGLQMERETLARKIAF
jgi:hypothetical protein